MTNALTIIPRPVHVEQHDEKFIITDNTAIVADRTNQANADYLRALLSTPTGFDLPIREDGATNAIHLHISGDTSMHEREGYQLTVHADRIEIEAPETAGIFYGIQTLRQLLPIEIEEKEQAEEVVWQAPGCVIRDWPRFAWRGFMLDEGRHFHGKATVLQLLDQMALQKLNIFHWHLTEDQGWRIEIKRYPKLTEIGSHRKGTSYTLLGKQHDGVPHGGFYTQTEIREIVAYAAARHIMIVPEVEFPGHSLAALAAYPELSCTGGPFEVSTRFGILPDLYCAGKEEMFAFLEDVLNEILSLFPTPVIHIGGDEAPKGRWKKCPRCQARIKAEKLKDERALQVYFTNRMAAYLKKQDRRIIGWNQILGSGLDMSAIPQFWAGDRKGFLRAVEAGHDAIDSTFLKTYLDHTYALTPLSKAYQHDPIPTELSAKAGQRITGLEAPLWSEFINSRARLDYQVYPRLTAFAETGWTPREQKDWPDFLARLGNFLKRLDKLDVRYAPREDWEPPKFDQFFGIFTIAQPQTKTASSSAH
jgi:hexosaminidase